MKYKRIKVKSDGSFEDWRKRAGTFVDENEIDQIIDYDCDAYDEEGNPLFFFRKGVIPLNICKTAYSVLREAATVTTNRGNAGGVMSKEDLKYFNNKAVKHGQSEKQVFKLKRDGTVSNTVYAKPVHSGIIGYFDRQIRFPYCRQTAWTENNFDKFNNARPYIRKISQEFEKACPVRFYAQKKYVDQTNEDFFIKDTVFTTVTVNKNWRTAIHTDAGDCHEGLGNIAVLQAGKYEGGQTCLPRYRLGFDVRNGDVCFFNVHEWHGNLPIKSNKPYERISIVCYYRQNMVNCKSAQEELEIIKNRTDRVGLNK